MSNILMVSLENEMLWEGMVLDWSGRTGCGCERRYSPGRKAVSFSRGIVN